MAVVLSIYSIRISHNRYAERQFYVISETNFHRGNIGHPSEQMQQRKRTKLKLRDSCDSCSDAKIRCNKEKPVCSRCNVKSLTCCYGPSHRSGRRPTDASKASERQRNSPNQGLPPGPAHVAAPTSHTVSSSNGMDFTADLNTISSTDFDFSINAFDFLDIAPDGAASETTPFTFPPELSKMSLPAPEYDFAAFMSSDPDPFNGNNGKARMDSGNNGSNDGLTYDNGNNKISSDTDSLTYDPLWVNTPGIIFQHNSGSWLRTPPSSSYTPQVALPELSPASPLQPSSINHQVCGAPNANAIFDTPHSKTSCTCLTQALSLLAALHSDLNASSSSSSGSSPVASPQTPAYANNNNSKTTLPNVVGSDGQAVERDDAAAASVHKNLTLNTTALQQAATILNCECTTHNQQLIFFVAFIALKTMDRYSAAAQGANTPDRNSDGDGKCSSRTLAQLVLGDLHQVVRIVDTLSKRMREVHVQHGSGGGGGGGGGSDDRSGSPSQGCEGNRSGVGARGPHGALGNHDISASCFAQLENDLRKHLKAVTNNTMAVLRRVHD